MISNGFVFGDFNDILAFFEKRGGWPQPSYLLHGFQNAIVNAGLFDFQMEIYGFT